MALMHQGGQVTNITSPFAARQLGQMVNDGNFPTPNQPFDPQMGTYGPQGMGGMGGMGGQMGMGGMGAGGMGIAPNTYQYPNGYPGAQNMGNGYGMYPMGNQFQTSIVYATVTSGEPYIADPHTGELLDPGVVVDIHNENTWENYLPGSELAEAIPKLQASINETIRQGVENIVRPIEEHAIDRMKDATKTFQKTVDKKTLEAAPRIYDRVTGDTGGYEAPANARELGQERVDKIYNEGPPRMVQQGYGQQPRLAPIQQTPSAPMQRVQQPSAPMQSAP
jgi:hypothetical protein